MTLQIVPSEPARPALPTVAAPEELADRIDSTNPAIVLPQALLLAQERSAWLGAELRAQVEREGVSGIVGRTYTVTLDGAKVQTGEYARALFEAEHRERVHAASLAERIARLGLDAGKVHGDTVRMVVGAIEAVLGELGLAPVHENSAVMRVAQRAGLAARRAMGHDDGDPDVLVGPPLSPDERVRVLRVALERAEASCAAEPAAQPDGGR